MHQETTSNLYPCAHCNESGTCTTGIEGSSCYLCIKRNELRGKRHSGLACGICGGLGKAEPFTERMNKRIKPMLSIFIVIPLIVIVGAALFLNSPFFSEVLAFSSALIGAVIGFYFSNNKNQ